MTGTPVVRTEVDGHVGRITLSRPEQLNAITVQLGTELEAALRGLGADPEVNVIAIRGAGGSFCAGGDFHEVERLRADGPAGLSPLFEHFAAACRAIAEIPVPVVAVVEGAAAAGGFELMQAADIVLVHDEARIADNHIRFGQVPGGGSTQRLPRLVGRQQALGLLLSGDRISGAEAHRLGLAYRSWPDAAFDTEVEAFLGTLAGRRRDAAVGIKHLVYAGLESDLGTGLGLELDAVVAHISGDAGGAGVTAFAARSPA
ncbi:MAG: enoyl-CoA hydratase/isomerase family protein [Nocardioides sp.]|uniref:enoyl-CoA hydratase/isomerase family protein n=1 Tax=Nocardioides sp. TaxID=35761 RepID=UPI0039E3D614